MFFLREKVVKDLFFEWVYDTAVSYSLYKEKRWFFSLSVLCHVQFVKFELWEHIINKEMSKYHSSGSAHFEVCGIASPGIYERSFFFLGKLVIILLAKWKSKSGLIIFALILQSVGFLYE